MTILLSLSIKSLFSRFKDVSQRPRPSGRGLKKVNNSLAASISTLPGGALKGGGKESRPRGRGFSKLSKFHRGY